ncbi:hypothetical protein FPQ18DRAFT_382474 [Pyronema domesticum]|nr:hypothetical protein FPQ18DRAFT_382474 [Pyronema domesticum]
MEKIDMSQYEIFDINHVKEKHQLSEDKDYLAERLGKANTKRRQILKYNEKHHEKIVGLRPSATVDTGDLDTPERASGGQDDNAQISNRLFRYILRFLIRINLRLQ